MVSTATGVHAPIPDDPFDPQGDDYAQAISLAGRVIIPVANATERAAVGGSLIAQGTAPSAARPFFVFRADAPAGLQLEYTTNGTLWYSQAASIETTVNLTLLNGWQTANGDTPAVSRRSGMGAMSGTAYQSSTWNPLITTLPEGYRPARKVIRHVNAMNASNSDGPRGFIEINTSGSVIMTPLSGAPGLSGTSWVFLPSEPFFLAT